MVRLGGIREGDRNASVWWKTICRVREGVGEGVGRWFDVNVRMKVGDGRNTLFWYDTWVGDTPLQLKFPILFKLAVEKESKVGDMRRLGWDSNGNAWVWRRRLYAWEEESVRECVAVLSNIILQDTVHDSWSWSLDPVHGYSVKAAYRYITDTCVIADRSQVHDVWLKHVPTKVSLLGWRLLHNRLPTKDNLVQRGILIPTEDVCVAGCNVSETAFHLFLHCNIFGAL